MLNKIITKYSVFLNNKNIKIYNVDRIILNILILIYGLIIIFTIFQNLKYLILIFLIISVFLFLILYLNYKINHNYYENVREFFINSNKTNEFELIEREYTNYKEYWSKKMNIILFLEYSSIGLIIFL